MPMNTRTLERFAQDARRQLHEQTAAKLERVLSPRQRRLPRAPGSRAPAPAADCSFLAPGRGGEGGLHLVQPLLRTALHGRQPLHAHGSRVSGCYACGSRRLYPAGNPAGGQAGLHRRRPAAWTGRPSSGCSTGGCPRRTRSRKRTGCCWWACATTTTRSCPSSSSASTTTPSCSCPTTCSRKAPSCRPCATP